MVSSFGEKRVRIYQPAKNTMQSGRGALKEWLLEYEIETPRRPEHLMGWVSSGDTNNQVRLKFSSRDEAIAFAEEKGWAFDIEIPHQRKVTPRSYTDNFRWDPPADSKKAG